MHKIIITGEHCGNKIPEPYAHLFQNNKSVLKTHRACDIGSDEIFNILSKKADFSISSENSRLLVELNRSLNHKKLFSEFTNALTVFEKEKILTDYYHPYRDKVVKKMSDWISKKNKVIHISVHTFTPNLNGIERNADIGLLFDSRRAKERVYCEKWKKNILKLDSELKVRFNYPYLGKADGFITSLRKTFSEHQYIGIELEVNQKYFLVKNNYSKLPDLILKSFNLTEIK